MRLKNVPGSREVIGESRFVIHEPELQKGKWKEVFGNENPIHIEIGMGKGRFIMGMAGQHPEVNFIGIEKYSSVLLRAIQKMEEEELPNVRFIRMDAEDICNVFDKEEISEFLGSLAQGQACEKTPALQTVPCQIRRDLKKGRNTGIQNR